MPFGNITKLVLQQTLFCDSPSLIIPSFNYSSFNLAGSLIKLVIKGKSLSPINLDFKKPIYHVTKRTYDVTQFYFINLYVLSILFTELTRIFIGNSLKNTIEIRQAFKARPITGIAHTLARH
jgi:hypothetical protein